MSSRERIALIVLMLIAGAGVSPAWGRCQAHEAAKLVASDGAAQDHFGTSVGISGDTAIAGAPGDDDAGDESGAAYVFRFDGAGWVEQAKLGAFDTAPADHFGHAVAISGDIALIGAYGDDDLGPDSGSAYVFRFDGSSWVEEAKLTPIDGTRYDEFGSAVAISADTAVIGAWSDDDGGSKSGSAYVFRFDGSAWVEEGKLTALDGAAYDYFGASVAVLEDRVVIGAWGDNVNAPDAGSAYVFRFDGSTWVEEAKLIASDGGTSDRLGFSVAVCGDTVFIGAYADDDNGYDSGSVYVFRFDGSGWVEQPRLTASDGEPYDVFGIAVAVSADTALIGASGDADSGFNTGSAYVFRFNGSRWIEHAKLTASRPALGDLFGEAVALSGDLALIGAHEDDDSGSSSGTGYIFDGLATDCNQNGTLDFCDIAEGTSLDCNTNRVPDECDVAEGTSDDCNGNVIPDECEPDCNENGVPDECDIMDAGDFDADGDRDLDDYQAMVDCLAGPEGSPDPTAPECVYACLAAFDSDDDGNVDLLDFAAFQVEFTGH